MDDRELFDFCKCEYEAEFARVTTLYDRFPLAIGAATALLGAVHFLTDLKQVMRLVRVDAFFHIASSVVAVGLLAWAIWKLARAMLSRDYQAVARSKDVLEYRTTCKAEYLAAKPDASPEETSAWVDGHTREMLTQEMAEITSQNREINRVRRNQLNSSIRVMVRAVLAIGLLAATALILKIQELS